MAKNRILSSEDGATKEEFSWGEIRWLYGQYFDDEGEMTFGVVKMKPGEENALHSHPNCEEILYLIQGEVEHLYEGRSFQLSPGMAIRIPAGIKHKMRNIGKEEARAIIVFSTPARMTEIEDAITGGIDKE